MPRQSNGVYVPPDNTAAVSNQSISSAAFNSLITDITSELTNSLDRLGRSSMSAALPMGGNRITGLGDGLQPGDATSLQQAKNLIAGTVPPGAIMDFAMAAAPAGWLACDGLAVSRTAYAALFAAIGTTFGPGNGTTTFNLPNAKGRTRISLDPTGATVTGAQTLGALLGEATHALTVNEMPPHDHGGNTGNDTPDHTHTVPQASNAGRGAGTGGAQYEQNNPVLSGGANQRHHHSISAQGGGADHNNVQPSLVTYACIKT